MKSITVYFENEEFEKLSKSRNKTTWHDFVMKLTQERGEKRNERKRN